MSDSSPLPDAHHYVIDQNFPLAVTGLPWPPWLRLTPLSQFNAELVGDHDDWEILLALHERGGVDGFISNDARMLDLPEEMVVLQNSRLQLVVCDRVGHNALRATGLLMTHLEEIAQSGRKGPAIYRLRPSHLPPETPSSRLDRIAQHRNTSRETLWEATATSLERTLGRRLPNRYPAS